MRRKRCHAPYLVIRAEMTKHLRKLWETTFLPSETRIVLLFALSESVIRVCGSTI